MKLDEETVEWVAQGLAQVFIDNKMLKRAN